MILFSIILNLFITQPIFCDSSIYCQSVYNETECFELINPFYNFELNSTKFECSKMLTQFCRNETNFDQLICRLTCIKVSQIDKKCMGDIETGPCDSLIKRWGYDAIDGKCVEFFYGGCKGNLNNFPSLYECQRNCQPNVENYPSIGHNGWDAGITVFIAVAFVTICILFKHRLNLFIKSKLGPLTCRPIIKEFIAETIGTLILVAFGIGGNCQYILSHGKMNEYLAVSLSWALGGTVMGLYWSQSISGGHLNPAITITLTIIGRFSWKKLPVYIFGQTLGSFIAAGIVSLIYKDALDHFDGGKRFIDGFLGTSRAFSSLPNSSVPNIAGFIDQFVSTAIFMGTLMALKDQLNCAPKTKLLAFITGWLILGLSCTFGLNTNFPLNPARDFGPRLFMSIGGWGKEIFSFRNYWFLYPLFGQLFGHIVGCLIYLFFIEFHHPDSYSLQPLNKLFGYFRKNIQNLQLVLFKEFLAELTGTFILCSFGIGSVAQFVLGSEHYGHYLSINFGWAMGITMGIYWSGGVSGGHLNPSLSLALCVTGKIPLKKLFVYWLAQFLGAFIASATIYGVYYDALNYYDGGVRTIFGSTATAGIWSTYPAHFISNWSCFLDQVFTTCILVGTIYSLKDGLKDKNSSKFIPLIIGFLVLALGTAFGLNCGYGINPARDLSPRIFTSLAGWGWGCFSVHNFYSLVVISGQLVGGILGGYIYVIAIQAYTSFQRLEIMDNDKPFIECSDEQRKSFIYKHSNNIW